MLFTDKYDALRPQQTGMMMPLTTGELKAAFSRHEVYVTEIMRSRRLQWRYDATSNWHDASANRVHDERPERPTATSVHAAEWIHAWNATAADRLQVLMTGV